MKVIAMYLPQFHEVEENNRWWGKGFTEWKAVKQAEKLFRTHYQPRCPLNENYYDLSERKTMEWQAELMNQYGIDGLCFYHYWFKDGRRILEKPAENLLQWSDIQMPFCFSWANESWVRTWSKLSDGNVWSSKFETDRAQKEKSILLQQDYGDEEQWKEHFEYLLPFFKDKRYIKIDNAPIFMLYEPASVLCLEQMRVKWNEWAKAEGFNGIYLIGANCGQDIYTNVDADYYHEPIHTMKKMRWIPKEDEKPVKLSYDDVWNALLSCDLKNNKTYLGGFVDYDDTPRHDIGGSVIYGACPEKFQKYFTELLAKNAANGNKITFINAWNEWGEGMYLEPDTRYSYGYLEAILYAKENYSLYISKYKLRRELHIKGLWNRYDALNDKYMPRIKLLNKWLYIRECGISLGAYVEKYNFSSVAIYGMGQLGKHLYQELKEGNIEVKYAIDRRKNITGVNLKIYDMDEAPLSVDAVLIALDYEYQNVVSCLKTRGFERIILLQELLDEILCAIQENEIL